MEFIASIILQKITLYNSSHYVYMIT